MGQAQEWYREEAVGRAVRQATSAETKLPPSRGGATSGANDAEEGAVQEGDGGGSANRAEGMAPTSGGMALSREDVFVTTKIHPRDFGAERLGTMVDTSNSNLQVSAKIASLCVCDFFLLGCYLHERHAMMTREQNLVGLMLRPADETTPESWKVKSRKY